MLFIEKLMNDFRNIRNEYTNESFDIVSNDPFLLFTEWINVAIELKVNEPTAMALSTMDYEDGPDSRMVLLKGVDERGFSFFTNYQSVKGKQLLTENRAALLFFWPEISRQIRIRGVVSKMDVSESDDYFMKRPLGSRISASISPQSSIIESLLELEQRKADFLNEFPNGPDSKPDFWGGLILSPSRFEFWQGRPDRLHDRIQYIKNGDEWFVHRLAP